MTHLVVGRGEIGTAIKTVLEKYHPRIGVKDLDKEFVPHKPYKYFHICFPYSETFVDCIKSYKELYGNEQTVIIVHSTVPIGTCDALEAVSSPVRGIHPNLVDGIKTFVKYFGGKNAYEAAKIFQACDIKTRILERAKDCEAGKLLDTTQFGWMIILNKMIYEWCKENNVNFEIVYREWNQTYNNGYTELGQTQFSRPWMDYIPGKIGGHCVMPNCDILNNPLTEIIKLYNEKLT